jgi:hypothetical protein
VPEVRHQLTDGWTVTYKVGFDLNGQPAIIGLRVEPTELGNVPAGGLKAEMLRQIPTGRVVARTYAELAASKATYADLAASGATYAALRHNVRLDHAPRRGRRHDERFVLMVAETWDHVLRTTSERNLYDALVAELRRRGYEYRRDGARELVRKARRAGLLQDPLTPRGRTGGLTAKARQLLLGQ